MVLLDHLIQSSNMVENLVLFGKRCLEVFSFCVNGIPIPHSGEVFII